MPCDFLNSGWRQKAEQLQVKNESLSAQVAILTEMNRRQTAELVGLEAKLKPLPHVEGSSPRTSELSPSPAYLAKKMPTYNVADLIEHLEFRKNIHATYIGLMEEDPEKWGASGSIEFHWWAIEGYENAQFYLRQLG